MMDYPRIGNMELHLENASSTISMHHLRELWKSSRGTVLRIQALAVVAIIISFLLAAFGSCRRWSNRWIVQKGYFAAHVLSLSLGTYSIGLMQSSSVKSEMYPIWTVCLFTLFGCIDPVTAYNGLDYKAPLSKVVYGICLHCGYVLLMTISMTSSSVGNMVIIIILSGITFIKGFHRSLALMQQSRMRSMVQGLEDHYGEDFVFGWNYSTADSAIQPLRSRFIVDFPTGSSKFDRVTLGDVDMLLRGKEDELQSCYGACVAFGLSHKLHRHFLGLSYRVKTQGVDLWSLWKHVSIHQARSSRSQGHSLGLNPSVPIVLKGIAYKDIDYKWALKVIEIELAFLYDAFFTGNPFLHYYQAKAASLWALASFTGICCVGAAAAIPGTMRSHRATSTDRPGGCTNVVDTTTADIAITFVILVSLALLQLMHLIRSWTSNWARVAVVCAYARNSSLEKVENANSFFLPWELPLKEKQMRYWLSCWMKLKAFVATSTDWFDKYLWQDKIGQYLILPEVRVTGKRQGRGRHISNRVCVRLGKIFGLDYIWEVLWDLLGSDSNKIAAVRLDDDVKASVIDFLGTMKHSGLGENWFRFPDRYEMVSRFLPFNDGHGQESESLGFRYVSCVMTWHIVTCWCQVAEQEQEQEQEKHNASRKKGERIGCGETVAGYYVKKAAAAVARCFKTAAGGTAGGGERADDPNRRVANALSRYCAYLVVSAPELLPGPPSETKRAWVENLEEFSKSPLFQNADKDRAVSSYFVNKNMLIQAMAASNIPEFSRDVVCLAELLLGDSYKPLFPDDATRRSYAWETLALVWVRLLLYAAPYGNGEAHMRRLAQGGEFITHLWALLYHLGIREWHPPKTRLHNITTIEEAQRILTSDDHAVIAFLNSLSGSYYDELVAFASKKETDVRVYQTLSPEIAKCFHIDPAAKCPALVFRNKKDDNFTLYDGEFRAYDVARFVTEIENKLALATTRAQETASPSIFDNPINKQSSEDRGQTEIVEESSKYRGQAVVEIEEEIPSLS